MDHVYGLQDSRRLLHLTARRMSLVGGRASVYEQDGDTASLCSGWVCPCVLRVLIVDGVGLKV